MKLSALRHRLEYGSPKRPAMLAFPVSALTYRHGRGTGWTIILQQPRKRPAKPWMPTQPCSISHQVRRLPHSGNRLLWCGWPSSRRPPPAFMSCTASAESHPHGCPLRTRSHPLWTANIDTNITPTACQVRNGPKEVLKLFYLGLSEIFMWCYSSFHAPHNWIKDVHHLATDGNAS